MMQVQATLLPVLDHRKVRLNPGRGPILIEPAVTLANCVVKSQFNYWVSVTLLLVIQDCLYTPAA